MTHGKEGWENGKVWEDGEGGSLEGVPLVIGERRWLKSPARGKGNWGWGFFFALPTHREGRQAFVVRKFVNPALSFSEFGKS